MIIKSKKHIEIEKSESDNLKQIDLSMAKLGSRLSFITFSYETEKQAIVENMKELNKNFGEGMVALKNKYKIAGNIKSIDFENNRVIIE